MRIDWYGSRSRESIVYWQGELQYQSKHIVRRLDFYFISFSDKVDVMTPYFYIILERKIQATDATQIHKTNHCGYTRDSSSKIRYFCDYSTDFLYFSNVVVSVPRDHICCIQRLLLSACLSLIKGETVPFLKIYWCQHVGPLIPCRYGHEKLRYPPSGPYGYLDLTSRTVYRDPSSDPTERWCSGFNSSLRRMIVCTELWLNAEV